MKFYTSPLHKEKHKQTYHSPLYFEGLNLLSVLILWKQTLCCFLQSWIVEWGKKVTFSVKIAHSPLHEKWKTQEKAWLSQVFSFPYLATQLWHGANLQKGFSQNMLDARGREREEAGKTAGQWMFHYIWCCFPPQSTLQSKRAAAAQTRNVQAPCDHLEQSSSPLSHFRPQMRASAQIMCVWAQWRFLFDLISPCMFKSVLLPKKGTWYGQKRSNILRMINWQS